MSNTERCSRCGRPAKFIDVDFIAILHPRCSWLWLYTGVLKPKGLKAWLRTIGIYLCLIEPPYNPGLEPL